MYVYLRTNFQVSSIILTSFKQKRGEGYFTPPTSKWTPKNPAQICVVKKQENFKIAILAFFK